MVGNKNRKYRDLTEQEKVRLAGAIWIYGSIHVPRSVPRIVISMPIPLVYQYKKDVGGYVYRGEDGYFTLQISKRELVKKRLEEIQPFMGGEEAIQIGLALEMIRTKESSLTSNKRKEKLKELREDWKRSKERLRQWMEEFVKSHKDKPEVSVPKGIWNRAYDWACFMKESGYKSPKW